MTLTDEAVSKLVRRCLREGHTLEIEGLGSIRPRADGHCELVADPRQRVFIAYAVEERKLAERLADRLDNAGFDPWLDRRKLMPGQNWRRAIAQAIEVTDYFVACFSQLSVAKRGGFQRELRLALEAAEATPLGRVFLIPFRLDDCQVPAEFATRAQWVDGFPDLDRGALQVAGVIRKQQKRARKV